MCRCKEYKDNIDRDEVYCYECYSRVCEECADSDDISKFNAYRSIREFVFKNRKKNKVVNFVNNIYDSNLIKYNAIKQYNIYLTKKKKRKEINNNYDDKKKEEKESDKIEDEANNDEEEDNSDTTSEISNISGIDIDLIDDNHCTDDDTCSECIESIDSDSHDGLHINCNDCEHELYMIQSKKSLTLENASMILQVETMKLKIESLTLEIEKMKKFYAQEIPRL
jgi:hypothetical protein